MKKNRKIILQKNEFEILKEVSSGLGDFIIAMLLSGRSSKTFYQIQNQRKWNREKRMAMNKSFNNLKKNNYLKVEKNKVILTNLGERLLKQNEIINKLSEKRKKWDGKWRMVSFDIPNDLNQIRYTLRKILVSSGFLQIQKSVYIYPHSCREILDFLKENKEYNKFIVYSEISFSTKDKEWKKHFKKNIL